MLHELLETPISGDVPTDTLTRLPEWCVYIETPNGRFDSLELHGFWAHLEYDLHHARMELRLVLDTGGGLHRYAIHLGGTITEGIHAAIEASVADYRQLGMSVGAIRRMRNEGAEILVRELGRLVSVVLYLCADDTEIAECATSVPPRVVKGAKRPILPSAKSPLRAPNWYAARHGA